jgi:hypothetical protein
MKKEVLGISIERLADYVIGSLSINIKAKAV